MRNYSIEAVVLKNTKYKDADKIYTLLTKENGKISAVGRGVRKISSRRGGNLDTLNRIKVKVHEGFLGYKNIEEVSTLESFIDIKKSLEKTKRTYYVIELINKNIEEGDYVPGVYELLIEYLRNMSLAENSHIEELLINFEIRIMKLLGYELNLDSCVKCKKDLLKLSPSMSFNVDFGGFVCEECKGYGIKSSVDELMCIKNIFKENYGTDSRIVKKISDIMETYISEKAESKFKSLEI